MSGNLSASSGFVGLAHYEGSIQALGAPVPEPEHYAMMFAGLAGLGWLVKRRQSA